MPCFVPCLTSILGEAQKIDRFVETFSERYCECNIVRHSDKSEYEEPENNKDDIFILSFAIIMLNTDLHVPNNKRRMTQEQWIKNLRGVLKKDLNEDFLIGIYQRIKQNEMKTGHDHCLQVYKVQSSLVPSSKSVAVPNLALNTYRRLVCFCRLYEIVDLNKKEKPGQHQREVFLFNDLLLITKVYKKSSSYLNSHSSNSTSHLNSYRQSILLSAVNVSLFSTNNYPYGIKISSRMDKDKTIILFNARNGNDRSKFFEDLKESIAETHQMEMIRISNTLNNNNSNSCTSSSASATLSSQTCSSKTSHSSPKSPNSNYSSLIDLSLSSLSPSSSPSSSFTSLKSTLAVAQPSSLESILPKNVKKSSPKASLYI